MNTFNELFTTETNNYWSYTKAQHEIGFLISDQHFIITGGIGHFALAFYQMCLSRYCRLHFILDKKPSKTDFVKYFPHAVFHYPDEPISYKNHTDNYFRTDTYNVYKAANFHQSIIKAEKFIGDNNFTMMIANSSDSILPAYSHGYDHNLLVYTHLWRHIDKQANNLKFTKHFHTLVDMMSSLPNVTVATQSDYTNQLLRKHHNKVYILAIPMPDKNFLIDYDRTLENTHGVLWTGRYEQGKRPEKFLEIASKAQLPVKILTSKKSAIKFEEKCKEYGILEYDIRHDLIGQEKLDFMLSSRVLLNVCNTESYGIGIFECIGHMPVITLDDCAWINWFDNKYAVVCNKKNIVETLQSYYYMPYTKEFFPKTWYESGSLDYVNRLHNEAYDRFDYWLETHGS
jgi:hypothetical protein